MFCYADESFSQIQRKVYSDIQLYGVAQDSRNGPVKRLPGVTMFEISKPWDRVNIDPVRDANPFFHLIESAAMLAGEEGNSVSLLSFFAKNMKSYSDDGERYNAFYGSRLEDSNSYTQHQLVKAARTLKNDPNSRQAVCEIWDKSDLYNPTTKDKACNLMLLFSVSEGSINMTSFNRSNDAIWGIVSGANIVHLSYFHQFVAEAACMPMGTWTHVTNNLHVYTENPIWKKLVDRGFGAFDADPIPAPVSYNDVTKLIHNEDESKRWNQDWLQFLRETKRVVSDMKTYISHYGLWDDNTPYTEIADQLFFNRYFRSDTTCYPWLSNVILPAFCSWFIRKTAKNAELAVEYASAISDEAWRTACLKWLARHG